ncbi:MAG TPA: pentapeptide repeat-containing protein [Stellaceae bacterium]|nr:pentapeptide repeat-containing protein [Stellaceae bacterium]
MQARTAISQTELDRALRLHEAYRLSKPGGQRALFTYRDLSGCNLSKRDLSGADFTGSFLVGANLEGADLTAAVLFASNLCKANLRRAKLVRADLRGAVLRGADLTGADLFDADLRDGVITMWQRSGELQHVDPEATGPAQTPPEDGGVRKPVPSSHTDFSDAVLRGTRLVRADLRKATLAGADLGGADLSGADLRGADLNDAVLTDAVMENTHFIGANLKGMLNDKPAGLLINDLDEPLVVLLAKHERWVETQGREGAQLDLSGFDLRNAPPLAGAELAALKASDSVLYGLNLAGTVFAAAQLDRADLRSCNLRGADLRGVSLKGARLTNSDLRDCRLGPLIMNEGQRVVSRLDRAILRNVDLRGADLKDAVLRGADLSNANLVGARLDGTNLENTTLAGTIKAA